MTSPIHHVKKLLRPVRRRVNQMLNRDLRFAPQVHRPTLRLGSEYGGWVICPDLIKPDSIVHCFGVGEDISFDLAMIERFGVTVHAFDPTPKAMQWIQSQQLPAKLQFHNVGLADYDGVARFVLPRADYASYHMSGSEERGADVADCRVQRLSTIMRELGHTAIDVLKMDIEGAEYAALSDIMQSSIKPQQLLVEFHHTPGDQESLQKSRDAIALLHSMEYKIVDVSATGMEYSFLLSVK